MRPSGLLPDRILREIDRLRARRFLSVTTPATIEYVRRYGLGVRHGPFAGMQYIEGLESSSGDLVAKLLGTYERELAPVVEEWVALGIDQLIDIGAAEGYYAVGFAVRVPQAIVHAFDIDRGARERCAALAERNGVSERVSVGAECTPAALESFPERGVALLSDCEGAERELLDPQLAPRLRAWPLLVELHDFLDPTITETLCGRFEATHEIELIEGEDRSAEMLPELAFATARQRAALLSEHRPGPMRWAHMRPR
ncbi:MAG TPA: hypothetical protein VKU89_04135 [Solirubrobacteraceae bacterium]|nr:hypothetical protein [Solirubrobacteraceae bacterium]